MFCLQLDLTRKAKQLLQGRQQAEIVPFLCLVYHGLFKPSSIIAQKKRYLWVLSSWLKGEVYFFFLTTIVEMKQLIKFSKHFWDSILTGINKCKCACRRYFLMRELKYSEVNIKKQQHFQRRLLPFAAELCQPLLFTNIAKVWWSGRTPIQKPLCKSDWVASWERIDERAIQRAKQDKHAHYKTILKQ